MIKKLMLLIMVIGLLGACNNNKTPDKKADYRKDDYDDKNADDDDKKTKKDDDADYSDGNEWSRADKKAFDAKCLETLDNDEQRAKIFCPCFFEKISKKYSSMQEIDDKSSEAEGKRLASICMDETGLSKKNDDFTDDNTNGNGWTKSDENKFMDECSGTASKNVGEERANQYCKCMLEKMKAKYSSYAAAERALSNITKEQLEQLAADCNQ